MTVKNDEERRFYEIEAAKNGWGYRELERQINSALFERLVLSRDKNGVKELSIKGQIVEKPADIIKNPYILEFTGLEPQKNTPNTSLKQQLLINLNFLFLSLAKDFFLNRGRNGFLLITDISMLILCFITGY
jgi:predicted nuclease of restriction endonuclease-like (RecB) superfamily